MVFFRLVESEKKNASVHTNVTQMQREEETKSRELKQKILSGTWCFLLCCYFPFVNSHSLSLSLSHSPSFFELCTKYTIYSAYFSHLFGVHGRHSCSRTHSTSKINKQNEESTNGKENNIDKLQYPKFNEDPGNIAAKWTRMEEKKERRRESAHVCNVRKITLLKQIETTKLTA